MTNIRLAFYKKGPDNQRACDLFLHLRRPKCFTIQTWSEEEKKAALQFIDDCENKFNQFKIDVLKSIK